MSITPRQVEVGFHSSTLGWLSVRANAGRGGEIDLQIASPDAQRLHAMLPALSSFLGAHSIGAHTLSAAGAEPRQDTGATRAWNPAETGAGRSASGSADGSSSAGAQTPAERQTPVFRRTPTTPNHVPGSDVIAPPTVLLAAPPTSRMLSVRI